MKRDGLDAEDALALIAEAREQFNLYLEAGDIEGAEQICADYFGLEPDYLHEFI